MTQDSKDRVSSRASVSSGNGKNYLNNENEESDYLRAQTLWSKQGLTDKANDARAELGQVMEHAGAALRERVQNTDHAWTQPVSELASGLERTGVYLKSNDIKTVADDVTQAIKTHPMRSLLISAGVGYILGRVIRRRP